MMNRSKVFFNPKAFGTKNIRVEKVVATLSLYKVKEKADISESQENGSKESCVISKQKEPCKCVKHKKKKKKSMPQS